MERITESSFATRSYASPRSGVGVTPAPDPVVEGSPQDLRETARESGYQIVKPQRGRTLCSSSQPVPLTDEAVRFTLSPIPGFHEAAYQPAGTRAPHRSVSVDHKEK